MSFKITEDLLSKLGPTVRASAGLNSNDIGFYKSVEKSIEDSSNKASDRILSLINDVLTSLGPSDVQSFKGDKLKDSWKSVSNILDDIFETADMGLDEYKGTNKANVSNMKYLDDSPSTPNNQSTQKIKKPQLTFKTPIDNSEPAPFKPLLRSKPFAMVPFEETFNLTEPIEDEPSHHKHPYETEILKQEYNSLILEKSEIIPPKDWDSTKAIWVDDLETLNQMLSQLKECTEIAVDLEHHDYRTYYGLVCLMQISSREQDWIVDTLALREELHILNEVFANPQITKVFHGAFMDIIWLQRDLGLYVVSLFDTFHACKALAFPKMSLAYLLERFAQFKTSKKYQLADWRLRPLSTPMMTYARADTHFLLSIYDELKNLLLDAGKMGDVLFESRNVALRRFEYTTFRPRNATNQSTTYSPIDRADPWKSLIYQYNIPASRSGIAKALYEWRDQNARKEDESTRYIMSNQLLVSIASLAPTDSAGVLAASPYTTEYVRRNSKDIALLVTDALEKAGKEDIDMLNDISNSYYDIKPRKETINIGDVKKYESEFFNVLNGGSQIDKDLDHSDKSSFFGSISFDGNKFFTTNKKSSVDPTLDRIEMIKKKMELYNGNQTVVLKQAESAPLDSQTISIQDEPSEEPEEEGKIDLFEDKEDVVVLKNKKKNQNQKKPVAKSKTPVEDFNYQDAKKVIVKENRFAKNDKKRPSTTFDPYSQIPDDIKPAKKKAKTTLGRTISFVNKKKK